jgi:hypothetical protein
VDRRYPIVLNVQYEVLRGADVVARGDARTVYISRHELLIDTGCSVPPRHTIHAFIEWPVRLDDAIPLKLHVVGTTRSFSATQCLVTIVRYDFRTSGTR